MSSLNVAKSRSLASLVMTTWDTRLFGSAQGCCFFQGMMTMDIAEWRIKIDELDRQLVALINERAHCAEEIGKLKRNSSIPIYEPDRERIIFENIARQNQGPLSQVQLRQVYERLVDVMRQIQRDEIAPEPVSERRGEPTELEPRD